ncbi:MAG: hypothetical protein PHI35_01410 [Victivallaceae bacterium]|nr:hypothetical protein [Victivallaceae bacterium]
MIIRNESFADFAIDSTGCAVCRSCWVLTGDDPAAGAGALLAAARDWAGSIGDDARTPTPDGRSYTVDPTLKVTAIAIKEIDPRRCQVTFTAAPPPAAGISRLESAVHTEEFVGFAAGSGGMVTRIVWIGIFAVRSADIASYRGLVGSDAAAWSETGAIVTRVTPTPHDDGSYTVRLEAQLPGNPGLWLCSENDRLSERTDVSAEMSEFHVSSEMAGYYLTPEGAALEADEWSAADSCPFATTARLEANMIEADVRVLEITETTYERGKTRNLLSSMVEWQSTRVYSGTVAGCSGSYLKVDQKCDELHDSGGRTYTRLIRTYAKAPQGLSWNTSYWRNH